MTYRFPKAKKKDRVAFPAPARPDRHYFPAETLTGIVNQKAASDIEERFAIALRKLGIGFYFQWFQATNHTLPDQQKQVDFIVYVGNRVYPVEIYGTYFHNSAGDRQRDEARERELNDAFRGYGWEKLTVVWQYELFDQTQADLTVRRLFVV